MNSSKNILNLYILKIRYNSNYGIYISIAKTMTYNIIQKILIIQLKNNKIQLPVFLLVKF